MIYNGDQFALESSYIRLQCMCCYATESLHRSHLDTPLLVSHQKDDLGFSGCLEVWIIISSRSQGHWWTWSLCLNVGSGPAVSCSGARCFQLIWPCFPAGFLICMQSSAALSRSLSSSLELSFSQVTLQRAHKELYSWKIKRVQSAVCGYMLFCRLCNQISLLCHSGGIAFHFAD